MESYQSNTTSRGRDGRKSGLSSHHEVDALANESFQHHCSVWRTWASSNWQGAHAPHPRISLRAFILTLIRLWLYYLEPIAIPRLRQLHTRAVLRSNIERPTGQQ